jgi:polysaccharide deacetylase 2 family uncharacterized protein YibQ
VRGLQQVSKKLTLIGAMVVAAGLPSPLPAVASEIQHRPVIAIIIDDLGNQRQAGERAIALPGPVACAIMPRTAHSTYLAEQAFNAGKEVMLHLPMQPVGRDQKASPGQIDIDTTLPALRRTLDDDFRAVPHASGVNNHMGSLITRHPGHMEWLMDELLRRGDLFFVDSYTTAASVALATAKEKGVPATRRHIFLDNNESDDIDKEFARLKREARRTGFAIGIGHPYRATLEFLERELPRLEQQGFELVPVARVIELQDALGEQKSAVLRVRAGADAS